jgi:hypothetical protein
MHGRFVSAIHILYFPDLVTSMSGYPCSSVGLAEDMFWAGERAAGLFYALHEPFGLRRFERGSSPGMVIRRHLQRVSRSLSVVISRHHKLPDNTYDAHCCRNRNIRSNYLNSS